MTGQIREASTSSDEMRLDALVDQVIAACNGDIRLAFKRVLRDREQITGAYASNVSRGFLRGAVPLPGLRQ